MKIERSSPQVHRSRLTADPSHGEGAMPRTTRYSSIFALLALILAGCVQDNPAAPRSPSSAELSATPHTYVRSLTDLGTFGALHGAGFAINDGGEVAGQRNTGLSHPRAVF